MASTDIDPATAKPIDKYDLIYFIVYLSNVFLFINFITFDESKGLK